MDVILSINKHTGKGKEEVFKLNAKISIEHMDINQPEGWKLAEVLIRTALELIQ